MKSLNLFLVIICSGFLNVFSQEDTISINQLASMSLEEILNIKVRVSSTNTNNIFNSPSTVSIIDNSMIEYFNFQSLEEALSQVAGIEIYQTIIDRNIPTARGILQNFYANKVLLLINNIPTFQPIYGDGHIDRISIQDVDHIEILKGPASVLYGSNAYSAVINVVLKEVEDINVTTHSEIGYPELYGSGLNFSYKKNDLEVVSSLNTVFDERLPFDFENANGSVFNGDSVFNMQEMFEKTNFNLQVNFKSHSIFYNSYLFEHTFFGASPSFQSGAGNMVNNYGHLFNYRFDKSIEKNRITINLGNDYFHRDFAISADQTNLVGILGNRTNADIKYNRFLTDLLAIEFGLATDFRTGSHQTINGMTGQFTTNNLIAYEPELQSSAFAQLNFTYKFLTVLGGIRYTNNSFIGDEINSSWNNVSSRISMLFKINKTNSIKAIYGESFRSPTIFELYFNHPTVLGNPLLKPETSKSVELSFLNQLDNFFMQITAYYAMYDNLIQRVIPETGPPGVYQNFDAFHAHGFEFEGKYLNRETVNLFLNYGYSSGNESGYESNFKYIPKHNVAFGINKNIKNLSLAANTRFYSKVEGNLNQIEPQLFAEVHLNYKHILNNIYLQHSFSIKNLTGSKMLIPEYIRGTENINDIPTVTYGRRFIYSISVKF